MEKSHLNFHLFFHFVMRFFTIKWKFKLRFSYNWANVLPCGNLGTLFVLDNSFLKTKRNSSSDITFSASLIWSPQFFTSKFGYFYVLETNDYCEELFFLKNLLHIIDLTNSQKLFSQTEFHFWASLGLANAGKTYTKTKIPPKNFFLNFIFVDRIFLF